MHDTGNATVAVVSCLCKNLMSQESQASSDPVSFRFMDDSKELSTWERGAPAPQ